jgi:hypothetical protein
VVFIKEINFFSKFIYTKKIIRKSRFFLKIKSIADA